MNRTIVLLLLAATARAAPVDTTYPLQTDPACDPNVGVVQLVAGVFGSLGLDTIANDGASYDPPGDHAPMVTLARAQAHLCYLNGGAPVGGWVAAQQGDPGDGVDNTVSGTFELGEVTVTVETQLDCQVLQRCYTVEYVGPGGLEEVVLNHYVDPNLQWVVQDADFAWMTADQAGIMDQVDDRLVQTPLVQFDWTAGAAEGIQLGDPDLVSQQAEELGGANCPGLETGIFDAVGAVADLDENGTSDALANFAFGLTTRIPINGVAVPSDPVCLSIGWGHTTLCEDANENLVCDDEEPQNGVALESDPGCEPELGFLHLEVDAAGAVGTATGAQAGALYTPFEGEDGVQTMFESALHFCGQTEGGNHVGWWLNDSGLRSALPAPQGAGLHGNYTLEGWAVDGGGGAQEDVAVVASYDVTLECNALRRCYTFVNDGDVPLVETHVVAYLDGDLNFVGGAEDFGGVSANADPLVLYEFDQRDDDTAVHLAMSGDGALVGWEIGPYPELRGKIGMVEGGCQPLGDVLEDPEGRPADADGDQVTDTAYDVTLALHWELGPLAPMEFVGPLCVDLVWEEGASCVDEDGDGVCFGEDNCPNDPNPLQEDFDEDGMGDACDPPPDAGAPDMALADGGAPDVAQADVAQVDAAVDAGADAGPDRDGDGVADDDDNCLYHPNPDQADEDGDGVGDVCDTNDGNEAADREIHGLGLRGGGGCSSAPDAPAGLALLALLAIRRRRP